MQARGGRGPVASRLRRRQGNVYKQRRRRQLCRNALRRELFPFPDGCSPGQLARGAPRQEKTTARASHHKHASRARWVISRIITRPEVAQAGLEAPGKVASKRPLQKKPIYGTGEDRPLARQARLLGSQGLLRSEPLCRRQTGDPPAGTPQAP